jgi:hypothetical protein
MIDGIVVFENNQQAVNYHTCPTCGASRWMPCVSLIGRRKMAYEIHELRYCAYLRARSTKPGDLSYDQWKRLLAR